MKSIIYKVFAFLIFLLIKKDIREINQIIIDKEYPGWDHLIKDYLLREVRRVKPEFETFQISFLKLWISLTHKNIENTLRQAQGGQKTKKHYSQLVGVCWEGRNKPVPDRFRNCVRKK